MKCIQINKDDNVAIAVCELVKGDVIEPSGDAIVIQESVPVYHKIAIDTIEPGDDIIRYGVSIGKATTNIVSGSHVHLQNMKSNYFPTYLRKEK